MRSAVANGQARLPSLRSQSNGASDAPADADAARRPLKAPWLHSAAVGASRAATNGHATANARTAANAAAHAAHLAP